MKNLFTPLILTGSLVLAGCATTTTPTAPSPEGALSGYELVQLLSGARFHGPSNSTPGATFEQAYPDIEWRQTKGAAEGTWNPADGSSSTYKIKWRVKGHQWCENWGEGSECWSIIPLGGDRYDFIKSNGEPVEAEWRIESPKTGPLRLNGEQLAAETNMKYTGNWEYNGSGGNQSGTYETHYCADGTRHASVDGGGYETTNWLVKGDLLCYDHTDGQRCFEVWQMADGSQKSYRKAKSGRVTGQTTAIEASDRCAA